MACKLMLLLPVVSVFLSKSVFTTASSCTDCDGGNLACVDGVCLPRCVNVTSSGECHQCRDSRFYGKQCENVCPDTCLNSRCQLTNSRVVCTERCVDGKKGDNCGVDCPTSCTKCERYGDRCVGLCKSPLYYGDYCDTSCPSGCRDGCDKDTGECDNCTLGYRGRYCNVTCPMNCRDGCDRNTGECKLCATGHTGPICTITCSSGCTDDCDIDTDDCDFCTPGYRGRYCNATCPMNCRDGCDRDTGKCVKCQSRFTGVYCNVSCSSGCEDGCDRDTGECQQCTPGYKGTFCNETCPTSCLDECGGNKEKCEDCFANCPEGSIYVNIGSALLGLVAVGCLVLLGMFLWRRKKRLKTSDCNASLHDVSSQNNNSDKFEVELCTSSKSHVNPTYGVAKDQELKFVNYCDELQDKDFNLNVDYIHGEFLKLPPPDSRLAKCGSQEENFYKNRYRDVLPFDETRVFLQNETGEERDYINASYINGYRNIVRYVAAQGPSLQVVDDFWRMIWQLKTTKIVMLTNLVEAGKVKCEMYWPFCSSEYQSYGKVCVQCVEEKVYQFYTLRTLAVWKGKSETRTVRQFHFTAWPDHGVPEEPKSIIDFHRVVKDTGPNAMVPMIIHCSAGVGRSGTFIALDYLLDQARYEGSVCIYQCIQDFRFQRMKMVQTKDQYKFVYDMLSSSLQYRGTLPRYYSPVQLLCEQCWNKKNNPESPDEDTSLEENDQEYQPLWNCGRENRDKLLPDTSKSLSDVCAIISEDSPPLLRSPIQMQMNEDSGHIEDIEGQRISWDTAL